MVLRRMMTAPRVLLAFLLLAVGLCSSEPTTVTTQDGVTSATSGYDSRTSLAQVSFTGTTQMTEVSELNTATTITEAPRTFSAITGTTGQPVTTDGTTVVPNTGVTITNDGFMTTAEVSNTTTEEDNTNSISVHSTTVATAVAEYNTATGNSGTTPGITTVATAVVSQWISDATRSLETETSASAVPGSGSVTWMTSDSYAATNNYPTLEYTTSSERDASKATDVPPTAHVPGNTKYDDVTTSDVTTSNVTVPDVTASHVTSSNITAPSNVTASCVTSSDVTASNITASDVTLPPQSHSQASHAGSQYTTSDIIIIVVVTVVGGLIIISALVAVVWKLRLYRNLPRYFRSNGHAQEFNMAACNSADSKEPHQADPEIGVFSDDDYQPPESNLALELVPGPDLHEHPLFSKVDTPASGFQADPAALVEVPLHDAVGVRNKGFQGDNAAVF